MAKHWIDDAIKNEGSFSKQAAKAGKSTAAFAKQKEHAPGKTGKRARLAETLAKMRRKKGK